MEQEQLVKVFKTAVLARRFEAKIVELAMAGELAPSLHVGAGQEVAQIAAIEALNPDDYILYGHRGSSLSGCDRYRDDPRCLD